MNPIFKKLNFKNQERILVLNAPKSFESTMAEMVDLTQIDTEVLAKKYDYILAFAEMKADLNEAIDTIQNVVNEGDATMWIAYPKKSSKKYKSDISRDSGWENLSKLQVEPVRLVAIDADWSAMRLRKVQYIKNLKRKFGAYSDEGKKRVKDNK